ncbi:carbohydrate ABC transporter permease [Paenibacillus mucilaginosus]|uniref:Sugar transporter n=2 Tax=Paenibacillus mucilaginosus TaxID=61624 RepID=I0BN47_9BACL|nr:sugar ABC transporter permease [Paenibacillus mucilaginosus]AEI43852.1 sugar transport system (permease) (binding protein dependent transporter) [Paenibacillus mucilaginosus KNP414]AFH63794.1 sugar transporter [Paenibacillus mucilaginosus K02]MCG7212636.1 sugar ABC transporter permease [Paenibacillus mucilaginosus]WDM25343.1 sugar ABC transporter permease [Paenibacillus mucilaginosus]WFA20004.1 sugar ABC transporter permease [Paenibacillus mucilaginosus]
MNAKPLTASGARTAKKKSLYASEKWWGYLFVAPPFIGLTVFLLYPLLTSLYYSFTIFDFSSPPQFVGTENYKRALFEDPLVWKTLWNTFYAALGVPIGMAVSLLIAILLNQNLKGKNLFRMLFFLPTICSIVAMTLIWQWIFNSDYGLLNYFLSLVGIEGPAWLTDETWAMPAMIFQGVWGGLGISIIMYLAALSNVPTSLYEAATMDGAGGWKKFVHITVPGISPITFFILVTSLIAALQDFPRFVLMTGGGPNFSTTTIVYYLYTTAFEYNEMGYASAISWFIGIIIMVIILLNFLLSKRWVHYN